ncbi:adhesion G protein-coupled receptor E1-like [Ctenocephalides felis]|uniref:adhesion G protein-coupled receptor E1-like n=1 Tax=Ctenocephalides felis TaxID=7515 RepID=UPI000E6E1875|nr:adhesion G protein-coupled receptor E1-like [Ctenocephalides felis]
MFLFFTHSAWILTNVQTGLARCGPGAICSNLEGSYNAIVQPALKVMHAAQAVTIPMNARESPCGRDALCHNMAGSFKCVCPPGYNGDPMTGCTDINECQHNPCGPNALCTDAPGSYICTCLPDYTGDPRTGCVDIDECALLERVRCQS